MDVDFGFSNIGIILNNELIDYQENTQKQKNAIPLVGSFKKLT